MPFCDDFTSQHKELRQQLVVVAKKKTLVQCELEFYLVSSYFLYGNTIEKDSVGIYSTATYAQTTK